MADSISKTLLYVYIYQYAYLHVIDFVGQWQHLSVGVVGYEGVVARTDNIKKY